MGRLPNLGERSLAAAVPSKPVTLENDWPDISTQLMQGD